MTEEVLSAPVEIRLPYNAPEVMELVFRVGLVSARHASVLLEGGMSERRCREILGELHRGQLLARNRTAVPYSPANAAFLESPRTRDRGSVGSQGSPRRSQRRSWEDLYTLAEDAGVRYVSELLGLSLREARSRYNRSYVAGRREHTYLRSEFYTMIAEDLPKDLGLVDLEAEGGVGRCPLPHRPGYGNRRLEPDGVMVFEELDPGGYHSGYPIGDASGDASGNVRVEAVPESLAEYFTVFVESDTGKQRSPAQIGEKVERYAQMYLAGNNAEWAFDVSDYPPVLFVSPTRSRSATVGRFIQQAALSDQKSPLRELHLERKEHGSPNGALDVFCLTNLQVLRAAGAWGNAYRYLCDREPGPLL